MGEGRGGEGGLKEWERRDWPVANWTGTVFLDS
jgi:hypothetical protein